MSEAVQCTGIGTGAGAGGVLSSVFGKESSLLFFFLLLVIIFFNCPMFRDMGDSLLFFFLLLVIIFGGSRLWNF